MDNTLLHYKALLFDVDNTLSCSHTAITPTVQSALQLLHQQKYHIGLCTGRHFAQLKVNFLPFFPNDSLHIVSGGTQVITTMGKILWSQHIPGETVLRLYAKATAENMGFITHEGEHSYANEHVFKVISEEKDDSFFPQFLPVEKLSTWSTPAVVAWGYTPGFVEFLNSHSQDLTYKMMVSRAHGPYIDITPHGVTKVTGIQHYCEMIGISSSEIIGFGDSENDEEFLRTVGFPVAMGNATDTIKALASRVIGSCNNDGLGIYLPQILAGAEL